MEDLFKKSEPTQKVQNNAQLHDETAAGGHTWDKNKDFSNPWGSYIASNGKREPIWNVGGTLSVENLKHGMYYMIIFTIITKIVK